MDRHSRLQMAVSLALVVALSMFSALLVSLTMLRNDSNASVDRAQQWLEISGDVTRTATALEELDGSESASDQLVVAQEELRKAVESADFVNSSGWLPELKSLLPAIQAIAGTDVVDDAVHEDADRLSQHLERFSGQIAVDAQRTSRESSAALSAWYKWVLSVSLAGVLVLTTTVYRVVLPLNRSIRRSLRKLEGWTSAAERGSARRELAAQVADGLDAATSESQAYVVIERAMRKVAPGHKMEVLLADSSMAHMRPAVVHPDHGGPGCGVAAPWSCPAVRQGTTLTFQDSESVRSCPHLSRHSETCSAVCSPLVFMGKPIGVMHAAGGAGDVPSSDLVEDVRLVAGEVSARLGTLRAISRAEMQASTDVLTGLSNRRATEDRISTLVNGVTTGAVALVEVGGLMALNQKSGKESGDRALRIFAEAMRESVRQTDWCGRWAGAQFILVMDEMAVAAASRRVVALRSKALLAFERAGLVGLTVTYGISDSVGVVDSQAMLAVLDESLEAVGHETEATAVSEPLDA